MNDRHRGTWRPQDGRTSAWPSPRGVWLSPCFVSPMRDAGYDVADYFAVDPRYGDNDDLAKLADQNQGFAETARL